MPFSRRQMGQRECYVQRYTPADNDGRRFFRSKNSSENHHPDIHLRKGGGVHWTDGWGGKSSLNWKVGQGSSSRERKRRCWVTVSIGVRNNSKICGRAELDLRTATPKQAVLSRPASSSQLPSCRLQSCVSQPITLSSNRFLVWRRRS